MSEQWASRGLDFHLRIEPEHGRRGGLEQALRAAIRDGRLAPGDRLPSSRALAGELGLARGTVSQVYEQLTAEGDLTAQPRSGTRVAPQPGRSRGPVLPPVPSFRPPVDGFDLRSGLPDLSLFPRRQWLAAIRRVLQELPHAALGYGDPTGCVELREALADYLGRARGVLTTADHVVVCAGYTHALRLICQTVARDASTIAFEEPTLLDYPALAAKTGLRVNHLAVDGAGLSVDDLTDEGAVVVTPAHQFPLGVTLSSRRRGRLVSWARRHGSVIVEDDYDGEFRYDRQPVGALQGLAPEHVVYAGTVSKTIAPALRIAWLVLPTSLVGPIRETLRLEETYVNLLDQLVLARLIRSGELDRHLRRCRSRYRRRRDDLARALAAGLPQARMEGIAAGLHAVLRLPGTAADEPELLAHLARNRVHVDGLSAFYRQPPADGLGVIVGYATPPQHAYDGAVRALVTAAASAGLG
jgi:GntR family transcriptional regulator/MocR family aminotransferase